jgi:multiple sugar transport system substrate-binding protein
LNRTAFERFSAATGATTASLATFEGLAQVATSYYEWTDGLTPDTPNDGRSFMAPDSWFNLALVQCAQLGGSFVGTNTLRTDGAAFDRAWDFAALPTLGGAFTVAEGSSSDYAVTGEVIAALGSTAGILYYGDTVTYADNTQEHVDYEVLPYPVWEGGQKVALQRGAGLVVASSDASREAAAVVFLKWLTAPEQNLRFVRSTGYLPVTTEAYAERMDQEIAAAEDPKIAELLTTAVAMQAEYRFMTAPLQGNLNALSEAYEDSLKAGLKEGRVKVEQGQPAATVAHGLRASLFPG